MSWIQEMTALLSNTGCSIALDEPMSKHTTFKIGGPADLFVEVSDLPALQLLLLEASKREIPYFPLGNGSNLVVGDQGIRGIVITLGKAFQKIQLLSDGISIDCGSAVSLARLCTFAKNHSLTGLECLWGIPGTAGGAAFMNAGAYGGDMAQVLDSCYHVTGAGEIQKFKKDELKLSYRKSVYSDTDFIITSLCLRLCKGEPEQIELAMDDYMKRRKDKQPLELPSAGSVFKRPEGNFAGALIEQCGLKGMSVGDAMVSTKHSGFIVNIGHATCRDVKELIERIRERVQKDTGILLECEIRFIGE